MTGGMTQPLVYFFGQGRADGTAAMKDLLGGKGAGLAEMTNIGIPVPPGFTIASSLCIAYLESRQFPPRLHQQVEAALQRMEAATGKIFGGADDPLLVSVRSGAAVSMPGMMETILNLGLNDETVAGLARQSNNPRFAWDSYRRFVQMYGCVVFDLPKHPFEAMLEERKRAAGVSRDIDLPAEEMQALVRQFKAHIEKETGKDFPDRPLDQLWGAIEAVFESWHTKRAVDYRRLHDIPDTLGTAVNVVAMVFGNLGEGSGTGVAFTRDPSTGERVLYGEYLLNAQGEDVVSGARDPEPIDRLKQTLPAAYTELDRVARTLERHFRDVPSEPGTRRCASPAKWWTRSSSRRRRPWRGSRPWTSTSSCTRPSIRKRSWTSSPPASRRRRAPRRAQWCSTPISRRSWAGRERRSSWSAGRPARRTSTEWWRPRPSSRRAAA